ncbi:O-antigen ligase family protein [Xanthomonas perforans]
MARQRLLIAAGTVTLTVSVWGLLRLGSIGTGFTIALFGALVLCLIPRPSLPALALAIWALVPRRITVDLIGLDMIYPLMAIVMLWALRTLIGGRATMTPSKAGMWLSALIVCAVVWFCFVTLLTRAWGESLTWTGAFVLLLAVPALLSDALTVRWLQRTMLVLAGLLAVFALLEFALQRNPVYDPIYSALGSADVQVWSVYRAHAAFGHPLYASLFFSATAAFSLGRFLETGRSRYILLAALIGVATVVTVSRSGIVSAGVSIALLLLLAVFRAKHLSGLIKSALVLLAVGGFGLVMQFGAFAERSTSAEASSSSTAREWVVELALEAAADSSWLGSGPGTSADAVRALNGYQLLVENGYLQLLVSVGVVGLLLVIAVIAMIAVVALRRGRFAALGMLAAVSTSIAGFNGLESNPSMLILFGAAAAFALAPGTSIPESRAIELRTVMAP